MLAYLIPCCPVAKSRKGSTNNNIQAQVSSFEMKKGKGKTGVEFCFYNEKEHKQLTQEQKKELKEYREASAKGGAMKKPSDRKRFRRSDFKNKKKNFDKRRRTNKEDFDEKVKGIISETVSTLIERKEDESKKNASVGAVSLQSQLTRNNILKSTSKKGSISGFNMRRILYHMTYRFPPAQNEDDSETETKSYNSMSSPSRSYD